MGYAGFVPGMRSANLHGAPWRDLLTPRHAPAPPSPRRLLVMRTEQPEPARAAPARPAFGEMGWDGGRELGGGGGGGGGGMRRPLSARQYAVQSQARQKLRKGLTPELYAA